MARRVLVVDDSATLRKIVRTVLEEAGYEVESAVDGADGLERVQRAGFDLVLVDFVMPRLNGYQLTQAIRSIPALRALPVVLISARAEQIGGRFMAQTGAAFALVKPFTPTALLDTVARALDTSGAVEPSTDELVETSPRTDRPSMESVEPLDPYAGDFTGGWFDDGPAEAEARSRSARSSRPSVAPRAPRASMPAPAPPPGAVRDAAAAEFAAVLGRALLPLVNDLVSAGEAVSEDALVRAVRAYLPPAALASLGGELRLLDPSLRGPLGLEGLLAVVPLGEVLQLLNLQAQTGLLVVERGDGAEVTLAFRDGRIDQGVGRALGGVYLLGRYLVADGAVARETVDAVASAPGARRTLLGEALVAGGYVTADDVERALVRQSSEMVYEVLRWPAGRFRFEAGVVLPAARQAALGLVGETLVLEGFRRIDEWRLIEQYVASEDMVVARDEGMIAALPADRLDADERRVLGAVGDGRTVGGVVDAVGLGSFDACKILYRLMRARLVVAAGGG